MSGLWPMKIAAHRGNMRVMKRSRRLSSSSLLGVFGVGLALLVGVAVVSAAVCTAWRLRQTALLTTQSEPFEQHGLARAHGGGKLLVIGDSTAVGTGASSPQASVAGLIGRNHPGLEVVNRAADGARFADMARQLQGAGLAEFDVILVMGGGNDVIRLTSHAHLVRDMQQTLQAASRLAPVVLVMPMGNVGNAPFFWAPWTWLMTRRSRELHALVRTEAAQTGALYVNVFAERASDPFAQAPERFQAADGLHPSDAGYALWYAELNRQAGLDARLKGLR